MILRERQKTFVSKCVSALKKRKNTLGIAPTGAGKTVCMAGIASEIRKNIDAPVLVLQHRDELVFQNARTFVRFMGHDKCSPRFINAEKKVFDRTKSGFNFAMVQTISRQETLNKMPPLGALFIDEAHHAVADSYMRLIHHAKGMNPDLLLYGTTATPNRGDRKGLMGVFDNCADQVTIKELIEAGHLVRPRCFVIDVGTQQSLGQVRKTAQDFDMQAVEKIMNKRAINEEVVKHWKEKAGERQTIVFCSNIHHAKDVTWVFQENGVKAGMIDGDMPSAARRQMLKEYDKGELQVLVNVAVLTEGFDHQPTSCVVLLRPSSWKSTMVQMIGRGLRKVNPEEYPGVIKDDCIVLDFGTSILTHGDLMDEPDLHGAGVKDCDVCSATVPEQARECPICGNEFPWTTMAQGGEDDEPSSTGTTQPGQMGGFVMTEVDILESSPFKYETLCDGLVQMCTGFTAWSCVISYSNGRFYAVGGKTDPDTNRKETHILANAGEYMVALQSADDWMREHGDASTAKKSKRWLTQAPTEKQLELLNKLGREIGMGDRLSLTKYRAACMIEWEFNWKAIKTRVQQAVGG